LRASSSLPGKTGKAPMNVAMSIPLFLVVRGAYDSPERGVA
jgi:hypothetical protein